MCFTIIAQVALKRQQAAEDALALNMRSVASGEAVLALPEGPIIGLPCSGVRAPETNAERRIKGEPVASKLNIAINLFCYLQRCQNIARLGSASATPARPPGAR